MRVMKTIIAGFILFIIVCGCCPKRVYVIDFDNKIVTVNGIEIFREENHEQPRNSEPVVEVAERPR